MPPEVLTERVVEMVEYTLIKFLAKRRREHGRITHLPVAITGGSRHLLDHPDWEEERDYREAVQCCERLALPKVVLSPPAVVTLDELRRYAEGGPLSRNDLDKADANLGSEGASRSGPHHDDS
jgi:hypothetical protein